MIAVSIASRSASPWKRIAGVLYDMGVITKIDRAVLAGYCQAYGRWVEAERKLREGPTLIKTPSGYVQQSPWLGISHKNQELMGRYMAELGLTPASRSRIAVENHVAASEPLQVNIIRFADVHGVEGQPATEQVPLAIENRALRGHYDA